MRRLTAEEVLDSFAEAGYELLDPYTDDTKLRTKCPQGHLYLATTAKFRQGQRCPECAVTVRANKRRTPTSKVKQVFEVAGYTLLTDVYHTNTQKLDFICPQGHAGSMAWAGFQAGKRCNLCANVIRGAKRRRSQADIEAAFEAEGYQLLSQYSGAHEKLDYICPVGHRHSISWTNFQSGNRCAYCAESIVTHEQVKAAFEAEGYQLLDEYVRGSSHQEKLEYICPQGHRHSISWTNFQTGYRCAYCAGSIVTHEQVKAAFEIEGYQLLDAYQRNTQRLKIICSEGHKHSIS